MTIRERRLNHKAIETALDRLLSVDSTTKRLRNGICCLDHVALSDTIVIESVDSSNERRTEL